MEGAIPDVAEPEPQVPFDDGSLDPEPEEAAVEIDADVLASLRQAIVFRQEFPPEAEPGLSFYGGAPIASPGFVWPCRTDGVPLHFLMQVDCSELPDNARLGLLPESGVLYFSSTSAGKTWKRSASSMRPIRTRPGPGSRRRKSCAGVR